MQRKRTFLTLASVALIVASILVFAFTEPYTEVLPPYESSLDVPIGSNKLHEALKETTTNVHFEEKPFLECLEWIRLELVSQPGRDDIQFDVSETFSSDKTVTLRLVDAPLSEVLRYTSILASGMYRVDSDEVITIVDYREYERPQLAWFRGGPADFLKVAQDNQPVDVRAELKESGIDIQQVRMAMFYPSEGKLEVRAPIDDLELIDAYFSSAHLHRYQPTWKGKLYDWRWRLTNRPDASATDGVTPDPFVDPSGVPDPFGEIPTTSSEETP